MNQDILRQQTKIAKAMNDDEFSYKDFAAAIAVSDHSFYNWLNGYYDLSYKKASYLEDIVINLIDE